MYFRFFIFVLLDIVMNIVGYIFNPIFALFVNSDAQLPHLLSWFQTYDADADGIGHNGSVEPRFVASTMSLRAADTSPKNIFCRYLCRVIWMYRNNAYGFSYYVLGAPSGLHGFETVGSVPADRYPAKEGKSITTAVALNGKTYFQLRYVKSRGNGKCYEANIGWKLGNNGNSQLVCRWTPFRSFETEPFNN